MCHPTSKTPVRPRHRPAPPRFPLPCSLAKRISLCGAVVGPFPPCSAGSRPHAAFDTCALTPSGGLGWRNAVRGPLYPCNEGPLLACPGVWFPLRNSARRVGRHSGMRPPPFLPHPMHTLACLHLAAVSRRFTHLRMLHTRCFVLPPGVCLRRLPVLFLPVCVSASCARLCGCGDSLDPSPATPSCPCLPAVIVFGE